jgi:4-amino-4-deoxy-L-arabinose transferase-like glycosyltransferase
MEWPAFLLAASAVAATALLTAGALRLRSLTSFWLAVYLVGSAELVVLGEALSLLDAVGALGYAVGHGVLLAAACALWQRRGRPRPPALPKVDFMRQVRRHPVVALLACVLGAAFAYQLVVVLTTPPNNWDSMSYHLPRAVEWLQRGGIQYVPDPPTERINALSPGGEIEILWTLAFLGRDTVAALPQLLAEPAALLAVYAIARRTGFGRPDALLAALLAGTTTLVALQSVTTQNDLLAASFVVAAAALLLGRTGPDVLLAGLAVGLALGTKLTTVWALPLLLVLAAISLPRRLLVRGLAAAAAAFLLVGAYGYVLNVVETGSVIGERAATDAYRPDEITWDGTVSTVARIVYRFADLSGLHAKQFVPDAIERGGRAVFDALGIEPNPPETSVAHPFDFAVGQSSSEDISYFGPLGALLYLPLSLGLLVAALARRVSWEQGVLAAALPVTVIEIALTYRYNLWLGRFLITSVLLVAPLAAILYRKRLLAGFAATIGAVTLVAAHAFNGAKPVGLDGTTPVWSLARPEAQALTRPELATAVVAVDRISPRARVGIFELDEWAYPLYGRELDRRVVPLRGVDPLAGAERRGVDWVVVGRRDAPVLRRKGWSRLELGSSPWTIYRRA